MKPIRAGKGRDGTGSARIGADASGYNVLCSPWWFSTDSDTRKNFSPSSPILLQQRSSVFIHCSNLGYVVSSPHQKSEFGVRGSQTLLECSETVSMSSGKCIRPPVCSGVFNPRIFENPRQQSRKMKNSTSELFRT